MSFMAIDHFGCPCGLFRNVVPGSTLPSFGSLTCFWPHIEGPSLALLVVITPRAVMSSICPLDSRGSHRPHAAAMRLRPNAGTAASLAGGLSIKDSDSAEHFVAHGRTNELLYFRRGQLRPASSLSHSRIHRGSVVIRVATILRGRIIAPETGVLR